MNPTTSLDFSRKLFEIIGDENKEKTENYWFSFTENGKETWCVNTETECEIMNWDFDEWFPTYTFGELLRVIPLIAEKKGWGLNKILEVALDISRDYSIAETPDEGRRAVEAFL